MNQLRNDEYSTKKTNWEICEGCHGEDCDYCKPWTLTVTPVDG